jgi:hypothetical protein
MTPFKGVYLTVALLLMLTTTQLALAVDWELYWEPGVLPPDPIVATGVFADGTIDFQIVNGTHLPYDKMWIKLQLNGDALGHPKYGYIIFFGFKPFTQSDTTLGELKVRWMGENVLKAGEVEELEHEVDLGDLMGPRWPMTVRFGAVAWDQETIVGVLMSTIEIPRHTIEASMWLDKAEYGKDEALTFTIKNSGLGEIGYGDRYDVERFDGGEWTRVRFRDGMIFWDRIHSVGINETRSSTIRLSDTLLSTGRHRLVMNVSCGYEYPLIEKSLYTEFNVVGENVFPLIRGYFLFVGVVVLMVALFFMVVRIGAKLSAPRT